MNECLVKKKFKRFSTRVHSKIDERVQSIIYLRKSRKNQEKIYKKRENEKKAEKTNDKPETEKITSRTEFGL